ncbi:hypothetical protein ASPWEDRAFT_170375, partial [Aspergillus wentii DTO 134E9]
RKKKQRKKKQRKKKQRKKKQRKKKQRKKKQWSTRPAKMSRTEIPESTQNTQAEDAGKAPGTNIGGSSGEGKLVL